MTLDLNRRHNCPNHFRPAAVPAEFYKSLAPCPANHASDWPTLRQDFVDLLMQLGEAGFEPAKAEPPDLQSGPFGHSGIPPRNLCLACRSIQCLQVCFRLLRPDADRHLNDRCGLGVGSLRTNWRSRQPVLFLSVFRLANVSINCLCYQCFFGS